MNKPREIVYYDEQHTMMWQEVTVKINESVLKQMLSEELNEENKRELIQTYYVSRLSQDIEIKEKTHYGAWNAAIDNIEHIYQYEEQILNKIKNNVTKEDINKEVILINEKILALSDKEKFDTIVVMQDFIQKLGMKKPVFKI